jgi:hypothetical protein
MRATRHRAVAILLVIATLLGVAAPGWAACDRCPPDCPMHRPSAAAAATDDEPDCHGRRGHVPSRADDCVRAAGCGHVAGQQPVDARLPASPPARLGPIVLAHAVHAAPAMRPSALGPCPPDEPPRTPHG